MFYENNGIDAVGVADWVIFHHTQIILHRLVTLLQGVRFTVLIIGLTDKIRGDQSLLSHSSNVADFAANRYRKTWCCFLGFFLQPLKKYKITAYSAQSI